MEVCTQMKKKETLKRSLFRVVTIVCVACLLFSVVALNTSAVSYKGSGTKADPYIVETAEQLNGIRDNLSAHYKLGNTIDMSKFGKFVPIGYEGERFTGSFACDLNSDGTPKYAIKNLTVYNDAGEKYGHKMGTNTGYNDFKEGKTKWQTGLFGYTEGASISNIAVLNANITSTVIGQNQMNKDFSINPGQHEPTMSTGILVGGAVNTDITGCMVSGKVTSKSNNTGGMVGFLRSGSLTNSYSTANVTNSGYYATGGLIGQCDSGTVSCCFTSGDVKGGPTEATTGGLIGQVTEGSTPVITSCYSTGKISPDANGFSIFGFRLGYKNYEPSWAMNCYTTSQVVGYSKFINNDMERPDQNLFILSGTKGRQEGFIEKSAKDIKAAFASNADFDVSGELPTLKNVHIIEDEKAYVPGAVSEPQQPENNTTQNSIVDTNSSGTQNAVNVEELIKQINAFPDDPDEITFDMYESVKEIKLIYEGLSEQELEQIPAESVKKYTVIYNAMVPLVMADIKNAVNDLNIKKLKASDYDAVMAIYAKYEFIGDNAEFMEQIISDKLMEAVEKVKKLKESGGGEEAQISLIEWILIAVISLFILSVLALNVFWTCSVFQKIKRIKESMVTEEEI